MQETKDTEKKIYNRSWNKSEQNHPLLFLNLIFQPNKPNPFTLMQNVLSVNASNKKCFQSDDSASFSFFQSHFYFIRHGP